MVEPQIVVLVVAGSSPVGHPPRSTKTWVAQLLSYRNDIVAGKMLQNRNVLLTQHFIFVISRAMSETTAAHGDLQRIHDH
jgi:hypothetical protein